MITNDYYSIAKEILTRAYPRRVKYLDSPHKSWDEDTKDIWVDMTPNERGWYVLFNLVEYWHDWRALDAISPSPEITTKYHKIYNDRRNAYNRDLATVSVPQAWTRLIEDLKREALNTKETRTYVQRYSARDIPTELRIERPDHNPAAFTIRKKAGDDPTVPETWTVPPRY
jgi:hypothetical protein